MDESTENYFRLLNAQNARIAAYEAKKKAEVQPDPIRVQREQERREKWGTLRAREKPTKRPHRAHRVGDYIDLS